MKQNEKGFTVVLAMMTLAILTLFGVSALQVSITESQISTNHSIHMMNFYAAESGISTSTDVAKTTQLDNAWTDTWPITGGGTLSNDCSYTFSASEGDPGDVLPDLFVEAHGTHIRGGDVEIHATFTYVEAFTMPGAPIHAVDEALTIQGSPAINIDSFGACAGQPTPPEVIYDLEVPDTDVAWEGAVECTNDPCRAERYDAAGAEPILWAELRENILMLSGGKLTELPETLGEASAPGIFFITPPEGGIKIQGNLTGYGILFIDGDVNTLSGSVTWNGIVVVNGNVLNKITGNVVINGSLFLNNAEPTVVEDDDLFGNLTINYSCEDLRLINHNTSRYRMTTWRRL